MRMASVGHEMYGALVRRRTLIVACAAMLVAVLFLANAVLFTRWGAAEALKTLFDPGRSTSALKSVIWSYRVPESCFGLLAGVALGMAGAEMQTILSNPLAEPYTLGISMSAAFGAALVIAFGIGTGSFGVYASVVLAFVCAMMSCAAIYLVTRRPSTGKVTIILTGVALLFLFQAMVNGVQSLAGREASNAITFWMFGSLSRYTDMTYVYILAVAVALVGVLFAMNLWRLSALKLGDEKVYSLGIDASKLRRNTIIGVSAVTAVAVSFTGTIGFVGLVGPHMARMLVGDDQRFLLPMSALCGAVFLLASSVLIKGLSLTMPIGVITSLVGVPFFLYLLLGRKRRVVA